MTAKPASVGEWSASKISPVVDQVLDVVGHHRQQPGDEVRAEVGLAQARDAPPLVLTRKACATHIEWSWPEPRVETPRHNRLESCAAGLARHVRERQGLQFSSYRGWSLSAFRGSGRGRLLGKVALVTGGSSLPYAVSKAAVVHLTRCLAVALAPAIRVNAVAPGLMLTRWNDQLTEDGMKRYRERSLLGRPVQVEHVASVIVELATNPGITGQIAAVDAGFTVR